MFYALLYACGPFGNCGFAYNNYRSFEDCVSEIVLFEDQHKAEVLLRAETTEENLAVMCGSKDSISLSFPELYRLLPMEA